MLLPHFVIVYLDKKMSQEIEEKKIEKKESFIYLWQQRRGSPISFSKNNSNFEYIVSVQGSGYSGSGTVIDLLREIPQATVFGHVGSNGSLTTLSKKNIGFEFELVRLAGGLFEIEKLIDSSNIFINDALIKRFIQLFEHEFPKIQTVFNDKKVLCDLFVNFFNNIVDFSLDNLPYEYFNPALKYKEQENAIYFLKKQTRDEFIRHCADLLAGIFTLAGNNKLLVLDQFFTCGENDFQRNEKYIPNLKTIFVQRDPRDIFMSGLINNDMWVPYYDVEKFVKWYNYLSQNFLLSNENTLCLRFEDIVLNYETEKNKIFQFLSLTSNDHVNIKQNFNPSISMKNIGLWKSREDLKEQINYIENNLSKWCYETDTDEF